MAAPSSLSRLPIFRLAVLLLVGVLCSTTASAERRRFMLLTTQRSGSTWLETVLDSHPEINCFTELMNRGVEIKKGMKNIDQEVYHNWTTHHRLLERFYKRGSAPIIGFRQMYHCIGPEIREQFFRWAARHNVVIIHLIRHSRLEAFVSHVNAQLKTQYYHRNNISDVIKAPPIHVDVEQFLAYAEERERDALYFRFRLEGAANISYYEIAYEAYYQPEHHAAHRRAIYAFLGVKDVNFENPITERKSNFQSCEERIENWNEVVEKLRPNHRRYIDLCLRTAKRDLSRGPWR